MDTFHRSKWQQKQKRLLKRPSFKLLITPGRVHFHLVARGFARNERDPAKMTSPKGEALTYTQQIRRINVCFVDRILKLFS